eukprot:5184900-Pyramimonas_sp.AAC.1
MLAPAAGFSRVLQIVDVPTAPSLLSASAGCYGIVTQSNSWAAVSRMRCDSAPTDLRSCSGL